ncbi:MAG: single-stranded-DNA-specific exonuclease RecJ [Patescibacteria group bacterium]|nr:single-stranded-DNA-specific exonuclease RecJ [Patescibacteria group bacterium]MDD5715175.1 single-stranded-DNA-specific exonuclease RecJ [Patescibacteria group bacterium]
MKRTWLVAKPISDSVRARFAEVDPIIVQLLHNRGFTTQTAIDEFLNPDYGQDLHDPFVFKDMARAVSRIFAAIEKREVITVYGDYDADGVSASIIMVSTLRKLGADVNIYIPHRQSEGYGLNVKTVDDLARSGTKLIVTVDCGIANKLEIERANTKGVDVVVTDHHEQPPELPPAYAIINPHLDQETYPFRELSGAGVAFKVVQALLARDGATRVPAGFEKWLLDIVAIGTIGDCVPIIGENRTLARYGLVVLRKTKRHGLQAIARSARLDIATVDTNGVSFSIVPRLNAAGRMHHANIAYELLMTEDASVAADAAAGLERTNQQRQRLTETMVAESRKQIGSVGTSRLLSAIGDGWQAGVVGLVAGKLADEFQRPVLIMGRHHGEVIGSGRSIEKFDITKALIECREYLVRFGGHAEACGFTLQAGKVAAFLKKMVAIANREIRETDMVKRIMIDAAVPLDAMTWDLVTKLQDFEPFGIGNHQPRFVAYKLTIAEMHAVGKDGKHLRFVLQDGATSRKFIAFGFGKRWCDALSIGDTVDVVFEISFNEWNGSRELQLKVIDIVKCTD